MTKQRRCAWCGASFPLPSGPGRPPRFCRRSHRQRAYEARQLAERHALGDDDVLFSRSGWETLRDALFRLDAALQDVDTDLAEDGEAREALWQLYRTAADVRSVGVEPKAIATEG